jgi:hypothetical protein
VFPETKLQREVSSLLDQARPTFPGELEAGVGEGEEEEVVVEDGEGDGVEEGVSVDV